MGVNEAAATWREPDPGDWPTTPERPEPPRFDRALLPEIVVDERVPPGTLAMADAAGTVHTIRNIGAEPTTGPYADPNGCSWCGALERGHGESHDYSPPADTLRLLRMKARREARLNPPAAPRTSPDSYVTLTANNRAGDALDALQYTLDAFAQPVRPPESAAERMRSILAHHLGEQRVRASGTPGPSGGIYDRYRRYRSGEAQDAANYLLAQYAQGRERSTLTLSPQPPEPPDARFPGRVRFGDGPWMPARVEVEALQFPNYIDYTLEPRRPPHELLENCEATFDFTASAEQLAELARALGQLGRTVSQSLAPAFSSLAQAVRPVAERIAARLDPELEAARHWPAPTGTQTCAHVCGPDPGHSCDARATTTIRHALPSGGQRTLPLCGPCAAAESAAASTS
jgi:hypothetical protein